MLEYLVTTIFSQKIIGEILWFNNHVLSHAQWDCNTNTLKWLQIAKLFYIIGVDLTVKWILLIRHDKHILLVKWYQYMKFLLSINYFTQKFYTGS